MFNATNLLRAAGTGKQLTNYYRSDGFNMLVNALVSERVPDDEIMKTTRGNNGSTLLHPIFLIDFLRWTGNANMYYDGCIRALVKTENNSHVPVGHDEHNSHVPVGHDEHP